MVSTDASHAFNWSSILHIFTNGLQLSWQSASLIRKKSMVRVHLVQPSMYSIQVLLLFSKQRNRVRVPVRAPIFLYALIVQWPGSRFFTPKSRVRFSVGVPGIKAQLAKRWFCKPDSGVRFFVVPPCGYSSMAERPAVNRMTRVQFLVSTPMGYSLMAKRLSYMQISRVRFSLSLPIRYSLMNRMSGFEPEGVGLIPTVETKLPQFSRRTLVLHARCRGCNSYREYQSGISQWQSGGLLSR